MKTKTVETEIEQTSNEKLLILFKESMQMAGDATIQFGIKNTLMMLALEYIQSERIDGESLETRKDFVFHLTVLNEILDDLSECDKLPESEKILHFEKFSNASIEYASEIKETLNALSLIYIRSERIEGSSQKVRDVIAFHFYVLNCLIDDRIEYAQAIGLS